MRAMALDILFEYRLAQVSGALRSWLERGGSVGRREVRHSFASGVIGRKSET
jgi:hypothetical protein